MTTCDAMKEKSSSFTEKCKITEKNCEDNREKIFSYRKVIVTSWTIFIFLEVYIIVCQRTFIFGLIKSNTREVSGKI